MVDFLRVQSRNKRTRILFLLSAFCGAGVLLGFLPRGNAGDRAVAEIVSADTTSGLAGDERAAVQALEQADALWQNKDLVNAAFAYLAVLEDYPRTPAGAEAYNVLGALGLQVKAGTLPPEGLLEFDARLPGFDDLKTAEGRHVLQSFLFTKAIFLRDAKLQDMAFKVFAESNEVGTQLLALHPNSWVHLVAVPEMMAAARQQNEATVDALVEQLEKYVAVTRPCVGTWASHYVLVDYWVHDGMDRSRANRHAESMLTEQETSGISAILASPIEYGQNKNVALWGLGFSEFLLDRTPEALDHLSFLIAQGKTDAPGLEREWAGMLMPQVIRKAFPNNSGRITAAYEDYMAQFPDGKYHDWALIGIGREHLNAGQPEKAAKYFQQVVATHTEREAGETATMALEEATRLVSLKSQASVK